jgi:hypothetical protein
MIIYPAKHWFETRLVELEPNEKEIFYRHPTLPLKINQIGIVYFDDEEQVFESAKGQIYRLKFLGKNGKAKYLGIGTRAKVCYEAYHQLDCQGKHFLHVDGNPANCTKENLIPAHPPLRTKDPEGYEIYQKAIKARKKFVDRSVQYMIQREEWVLRKGGEINHYWQLFGSIPSWLINARSKVVGHSINLNKIPTVEESKYTQEELTEITNLYKSGMTPKQIHERMEYSCLDDTRRIIKKLRIKKR